MGAGGVRDGVSVNYLRVVQGAQRLAQGRLVAFPTETVYGLGADAENPQAIARIYAAKRRPSDHPLIVHLAPDTDPGYWAARVPAPASHLMAAFWPGPLTLILPRAHYIPAAVSGGQDSIGLRCPSHPVAQALLHAFAGMKPHGCGGVAAPSANQFGRVSPTTAAHVRSEFPGLAEPALMILEGGESEVGIESTILDLSRLEQGVRPTLLRPGFITSVQLAEVLGDLPASADAAAPRVSGSLKAHYAPQTPVQVVGDDELAGLLAQGARAASAAGKAMGSVTGLASAAGRVVGPVTGVASAAGAPTRPGAASVAAATSADAGTGFGGTPRTRIAVMAFDPAPESVDEVVRWVVMPGDPAAYAHQLYARLRELDVGGYARIVIQRPPDTAAWQGVNDRIRRAAAAFA